jgi:hypothetical protein
MKKAKKKFLGITHLFFLLLMTNCTTEETNKNEIDPHLSETKIWYNSHQKDYNATVLKYIKELQWQNAIVTDGNAGQVTEVPFVLKDGLSVSNKTSDLFNNQHRLMFIKNEQNEFNLLYVQIFTDKKSDKTLDKSYNYYNLQDDFDGAIYVQELKTNTKNRLEFKNGDRIKSSSQTAKNDEKMCLYYGYWYDDGHFEPLVEMGCYGSPEGEVRDKPGYGGGGSGGGTTPKPTESCSDGYVKKFGECVLDERIFNQLNGKAKCIYERLMSSTLFNNAIKKFDGDFSVSHLKLTINNNLDANVFAITKSPVNYVTEIQFDNTKLAILSDLGNATVFAHEIIHAEIFRKMLSAAQNGSLDPATMTTQQQISYVNSLKDNFPGLMDYYYNRNHPTWNHNMMATHYRGIIADIIQQFDSNRLPRSTYESVTWLGLGKLGDGLTTVAWDNLSNAEKTAITNLINENLYKGPSNCN